MLQRNSAKILLISLSAPPGISNTPFPPVAILFKTDSQKEMRLSVFAQKTKFCSPTAIIKSWMLTWCWEQVLHRNTPPRADSTELLLLLLPLLTRFFLERQLKCKRQCFCASAPSRRKWRICKPQTELFWPRPLQCKVQTLLLWASVQGLWWKQQHITFPFHCFSINLCSSSPRQAKSSYLLLLHHRVSYFLHSLQTIAMMIKTCEHPLFPGHLVSTQHSWEWRRRTLVKIGAERWTRVLSQTVNYASYVSLALTPEQTGKNTKMSKSNWQGQVTRNERNINQAIVTSSVDLLIKKTPFNLTQLSYQ